jgi:hypothetical protein
VLSAAALRHSLFLQPLLLALLPALLLALPLISRALQLSGTRLGQALQTVAYRGEQKKNMIMGQRCMMSSSSSAARASARRCSV